MDKILIYSDTHKRATFEKAVIEVIEGCNELIEVFHTFQPFAKVTTWQDFEKLVIDPEGTFDKVLIANINLNASFGLKPDPATAAQLFNIDRPNYLNMVSGLPIQLDDCKPCQKARIKQGKRAISFERYRAYFDYIIFEGGEFVPNPEAIETKIQTFDVYAETPEQLSIYNHFKELVSILNRHDTLYPMPGPDKEKLTKIFGLMIERPPYEGKLLINNEKLRNLIFQKHENN